MNRIKLYCLFLSFSVAFGCDDSGSGNGGENSAAACDDGEDNDGDGSVDCDDIECVAFESCAPDERGDVSGMPTPQAEDVPKPSGEAENLVVLDWAGFEAAASYTFDDSQPTHVQHYDALQATGARMTFFVVSDNISRDAPWIQAVEDGHEMGNHTVHHCRNSDLSECDFGDPLESATAEIEECSSYIIDTLGQEGVWTMASPHGQSWWGEPAQDFVFLNRSVSNGMVEPDDDSDPFNLPAYMLTGGQTAEQIGGRIDSVREAGAWQIFCFHSILPGQDWYAGVEIDAITESIAYALEQDVWVDSMVNVGAYWMGQKTFTEVSPSTSGDDTVWTWTLPDHFPPEKYLRVVVDGGTLKQGDDLLPWSSHGYYEVSLDEGSLTLSP